MIQRKQTLFLIASCIITIMLFFIPFLNVMIGPEKHPICLLPGSNSNIVESTIYIPMVLNILILLVTLITVFLFNNRLLQYKVANLIAIFNIIMVGLFFLLNYVKLEIETIQYAFGAFLPIINVFMAFLAAYYIKKDEQLVRSADRIR